MTIFAELLTLAKIRNLYEIYAASATTYWESTTVARFTVPAGKRWFLVGGAINIAVSSTLSIVVQDTASHTMQSLYAGGASTGAKALGASYNAQSQQGSVSFPMTIMDAGEDIQVTFGTAQNVSSWISLKVLEIDV